MAHHILYFCAATGCPGYPWEPSGTMPHPCSQADPARSGAVPTSLASFSDDQLIGELARRGKWTIEHPAPTFADAHASFEAGARALLELDAQEQVTLPSGYRMARALAELMHRDLSAALSDAPGVDELEALRQRAVKLRALASSQAIRYADHPELRASYRTIAACHDDVDIYCARRIAELRAGGR